MKFLIVMMTACVALAGCQNIKQTLGNRSDGSLDYQSAQKLPPLKVPKNQATAEFTQLYPTPKVGQNTLVLTNESGKQYRLPPPPKVVK